MTKYEIRLTNKSEKMLYKGEITQYEYLIINNFIDTNYKKNKDGFISYITDLFFNKLEIDLKEYQNLYDLI